MAPAQHGSQFRGNSAFVNCIIANIRHQYRGKYEALGGVRHDDTVCFCTDVLGMNLCTQTLIRLSETKWAADSGTQDLGKVVNSLSGQKSHRLPNPVRISAALNPCIVRDHKLKRGPALFGWPGKPEPSEGPWYFAISEWTYSIIFRD